MASCIQCPNGKWVCGEGLSEADCNLTFDLGPGYYGEFTITEAPTTCRLYLRKKGDEWVIVVKTR